LKVAEDPDPHKTIMDGYGTLDTGVINAAKKHEKTEWFYHIMWAFYQKTGVTVPNNR
jgi:hypothetical protein